MQWDKKTEKTPSPTPTLGNVEVEKVGKKHGLHNAGSNGNGIKVALSVVPVDPVQDVEASVETEGKEIVRGDVFCFASLGDHEQLGQDRYCLQKDGEGPEDLCERGISEEKRKKSG